jgi:uncharacterized damage-inducible protein DinB
MANVETDAFKRYISGSLARIVACMDGLSEAEIGWRPQADDTSSLRDLAIHSLANAEENVAGVAAGVPGERARDDEFSSALSLEEIRQRSRETLERIAECLDGLTAENLNAERTHPRRGQMPCREVLLVAARHAAEHMGQAELTRDLLLASRSDDGS